MSTPRRARPASSRSRLPRNAAWIAFVSAIDVLVLEQRDRRALQRLRAAAVEERSRAGDRLDHALGTDRPGDAPARVAPVLGEAVEQDDRIAVDVLDVARGALDRTAASTRPPPAPARPTDVVRIELVEQQRAVELARDRDPARELVAANELAGRVARVRQQQRRQAAAVHLAAQVVGGERVAALALEQDRDRGERLEDVEQLLVGGVVGEEVPEVDVPEARGRAGERGAPAARDADVLGAVLRRHAPAVEPVVEGGDRLAQLPDAGDRRVLLIVDVDGDGVDARRRARQRARLGLPLPEVAPGRIAGAKAALLRLGGDVDDPRARHRTKCGEHPLFGHRWSILARMRSLGTGFWVAVALAAVGFLDRAVADPAVAHRTDRWGSCRRSSTSTSPARS